MRGKDKLLRSITKIAGKVKTGLRGKVTIEMIIYLFICVFIFYYRLIPLKYKPIINYIKINGNCKGKIVEEETTKSADAPYKGCPFYLKYSKIV